MRLNKVTYFEEENVIGYFTRCKKCKRIPSEIAGGLCGNCSRIVEVRKTRTIKCFGISDIYNRYFNRREKYFASLPKNGDKIEITWLPNNNGVKNAYIGMIGIVEEFDNITGDFVLNTGTSKLIVTSTSFDYIAWE